MAQDIYTKQRRYNGTDYDTLYPTVTPTDGMVKTANGKSTVATADVDYTTPAYVLTKANGGTITNAQPLTRAVRNTALVSTETNPTVNGEICWQYE